MKSALEHCIDAKAGRFIVMDGGIVFVQPLSGGELEQVDADAWPYLHATKDMCTASRKKTNDLVPPAMRADWKLSVQRQDGYTVWTVYSQKLPSISADSLAWLDAQINKPE
ncbi:MAG: hypothetical protein ACNJA3_28795 (plasmid) [Pseudomonas rhizophila]|uniref:hypothetical protein n=1 Tax=Pseudomonas rhizophila TaxID=2045200 RepID=UPI003F6CD232